MRAEAAAEAPFRDLLALLLLADGADPDAVKRLANDLVHWWKLATIWPHPLNGALDHEAQAVRDILAEHQARRALAPGCLDTRVLDALGRHLLPQELERGAIDPAHHAGRVRWWSRWSTWSTAIRPDVGAARRGWRRTR